MKKTWLIIIIIIVAIGGFMAIARLITGEDTWICENGEWVKHGAPSKPKPSSACGGKLEEKYIEDDTVKAYNWSTMGQGPYLDKISYAKSDDLLTWQDQKTILAEHASVPDSVYKDGEIFLYFVDVSQDGKPEQTGLLRSKDKGGTWEDKVIVSYTGLGDKVPVDPCPVLLDDGRIRLYFLDMNSARGGEAAGTGIKNKIYSAISSDGVNFTLEDETRFELEGVFDPSIIKAGDKWNMYVGSAEGNEVILATSFDGLNFIYEKTVYTGGSIPEVIFAFETFFLFTGGIDIASSADGLSFTKLPNRFQSEVGSLTADPSVIDLYDGQYLMFYKTKQD